ncbi:MAG: hypothetical protein DBX93_01025 [Oscillospiraceae bacterium]|nr:MAG: hypothetical protein DBX93_01025 [Oscillospiraceae bacterium]
MKQSKRNRKWLIVAALCLLLAAVAAAIFFAAADRSAPDDIPADAQAQIAVHFVDVGEGDCAIVETPDGNILIDAGTKQSEAAIRRCIDDLGITAFAYAIFTHPHADHIGSAAALVEAYPIDSVVMPNAVSTSKTFEKLVAAIEEKDCRVIEGKAGKHLTLGALTIDLLAPCKAYDDLNNMSVVVLLTYGNGTFLFTGDAETLSETDMLENGVPPCDVLKVGHHGSSTSSSEAFIEAVSPQIAVISVGDGNSYGHPHASTLDRLEAHDVQIYRTDLCGTITITCDGTQFGIETEK